MVGRAHQTMGMPGSLYSSRGRILRCAGCRSRHLPPGLRTRRWEGRPQRGPHSGQRRPADSDPALPSAEREPASGGGGPRLLKGEIAATRNSRPRLLPRKPVGFQQLVWRSRTIIYLSRGPRIRRQSRGGRGEPGS